MTTLQRIKQIEERFKIVSNIDANLSCYPLPKQDNLQVKTRKDKSKEHGEVFTPLWLVDEMLDKRELDRYYEVSSSLDLCAGYGQFTVRLIRKYHSVLGNMFDLDEFFEKHWICELQQSSAYKLMFIFGTQINIAIGDATYLKDLPDGSRGVYYYNKGKWENRTAKAKRMSEKQFQKKILEIA